MNGETEFRFLLIFSFTFTFNTMKIQIQFYVLFIGALTALTMIGCGKTTITGKITFTDGTPLNCGVIRLTNETGFASANINTNGTFKVVSPIDGGGIPHGVYNVSIEGAALPGTLISGSDKKSEYGEYTSPTPLIAKKYESPQSSGFVIDTKKGKVHNFIVEKPDK
jgi:hypothetical protein